MRFSASWAIVVAAVFLARPETANTQAPANSAESLRSSYAAPAESAYEPGAPRLLGPVLHARPIAEANFEESSRLRSDISDQLFAVQWGPEATSLDDRGLNFDVVFPAGLAGIEASETSFSLDVDPRDGFFFHAGEVCGATAGEIRFQGDQ